MSLRGSGDFPVDPKEQEGDGGCRAEGDSKIGRAEVTGHGQETRGWQLCAENRRPRKQEQKPLHGKEILTSSCVTAAHVQGRSGKTSHGWACTGSWYPAVGLAWLGVAGG